MTSGLSSRATRRIASASARSRPAWSVASAGCRTAWSSEPTWPLRPVNRHVVELTREHADQLALRPADLVVQAADGVLHRARAVFLDEARVDAGRLAKRALVVALIGDAAGVLVDLRL